MKNKLAFSLLVFIFLGRINAQTSSTTQTQTSATTLYGVTPPSDKKNVEFVESEFAFGQVKMGIPVTHNFAFQNKETTPIVISDVRTSCGCTTPTYSKQPILAGQKSQINVGYNAANEGRFQRTLYVMIDGEKMPRELLIKGEVIK